MTSSDIAIKVDKITKLYRIWLKEQVHDNLVSAVVGFVTSPLRNYRRYRSLYRFDDIESISNDGSSRGAPDVIWALREVSFEVRHGEVLGIIGRNGAGKSTLLKILAKIVYPTNGCAEIRGRISSLLEVGTGFHPELTGRENVYLNGTVLGMTKKEVDRRFDEIVAFSGVEKFIDTPVKRYSSGMAVRLAFSVAAHLEPEILLVDEVLAVGDAAFQKKCLGKMGAIAGQGRTVLFVSHNMGTITQLCPRAIWLENGCIKMDGPSTQAVSSYLTEGGSGQEAWQNPAKPSQGTDVLIASVRLLCDNNTTSAVMSFDKPFKVEITYDIMRPIRNLAVTYLLFDSQGILVLESMDTDAPEWKGVLRQPGRYVAVCTVPKHLLKPGRYHVTVVSFIDGIKIFDRHEGVVSFDVSEVGYCLNLNRYGVVSPVFEWHIQRTDGTGRN